MPGRLLIGTSGFAYPEWKGDFYPADIRPAAMLRSYASQLPSVEINYTFQRSLSEKTLSRWLADTPPDFVFSLKAPKVVTHIHRFRPGAAEPLTTFWDEIAPLGERLGPILFQCHPNFKADVPLLRDFLTLLPEGRRASFEFRHESWRAEGVKDALAERGVGLCVADTDDFDASFERTAPGFAYIRLRKAIYDDESLSSWAKTIGEAIDGGADVYCYFKHEDECRGPLYAVRLKETLARE